MFPDGVIVTIVRRTVTSRDEWNNDVYTSVSEDVGPCSVQPASSREDLNFADQLTSGIIVFVPYGTSSSRGCATRYAGGQTYGYLRSQVIRPLSASTLLWSRGLRER